MTKSACATAPATDDDAHRVRRITDAARNQLRRADADRRDVIGRPESLLAARGSPPFTPSTPIAT